MRTTIVDQECTRFPLAHLDQAHIHIYAHADTPTGTHRPAAALWIRHARTQIHARAYTRTGTHTCTLTHAEASKIRCTLPHVLALRSRAPPLRAAERGQPGEQPHRHTRAGPAAAEGQPPLPAGVCWASNRRGIRLSRCAHGGPYEKVLRC